MEELSKWNMSKIPERFLDENLFSKLPKDLDRFYDYILDRVEPQEIRNDMFVILKWILTATQPLTVAQLVHACATTPGEVEDFSEDRCITCEDFEERLVGLVVVRSTTQKETRLLSASDVEDSASPVATKTVSLAHFSVKEYLLRMNPRGWSTSHIRLNLSLAQLYAAQCCLTYMFHCSQSALGRTQESPFRAYAWNHWATHLAASPIDVSNDPTGISTNRSAPSEVESSARALELFNLASFPSLKYRNRVSTLQYESLYLSAGRVDSLSEFERRYNKILQDPEFPFDFSQDDLDSMGRRPMYRNHGSPCLDFESRTNHLTLVDDDEIDLNIEKIRPGFTFPSLGTCPQTIRLIILHPSATHSSIIICSQLTETLHNAPSYVALSYNWYYGIAPSDTILINGRNRPVKGNLATALRSLRLEEHPRVLWIDALCVNMDHLAERGSQVRMMNRVYQEAEEIILWLGMQSNNSDEILEDNAFYANGELETQRSGEDIRRLVSSVRIRMAPEYRVAQLFDHPIWNRLWILSEVILASRVKIAWGSKRLDWEILCRCSDSIGTKGQSDTILDVENLNIYDPEISTAQNSVTYWETLRHVTFQSYKQLRDRWKSRDYLLLPEVLFKARHFEVSDFRDKILTMVHLVSPEERKKILPMVDYNRSYLDLNVAVAEYCLKRLGNLDILSINNLRLQPQGNSQTPEWPAPVHLHQGKYNRDQGLLDLPSWVPAWHCMHWTTPLMTGEFLPSQPRKYEAGGPPSISFFELHGRVLSVRGFFVGTIRHILWPLLAPPLAVTLEYDRPLGKKFFLRYGDERSNLQQVIRCTYSAGLEMTEETLSSGRRRGGQKRVSENVNCSKEFGNFVHQIYKAEQDAGFWVTDGRYRGERVGCVTSEGHLALVPLWSREGDEVGIFLGGGVPYVLRKTSQGKHRLVGDW